MSATDLDSGVESDNAQAVRGGYAYVKQTMRPSRNAHPVHAEGTRRMYLCQCMKGFRLEGGISLLGRNRKRDNRFASDFRYR